MKKKCLCLIILFKNYIFYCFFLFAIAKVCIFCSDLIGAAVDSDDFMVSWPFHCQVTYCTKLHFPCFCLCSLYKLFSFVQRLTNKLSELNNTTPSLSA